jgi:hypothetical protein
MADPKQRAAAIAVSLALLTTSEQAVAQTAPELEARLAAGALTSRQGALPLSGFAVTPGIRYADSRVTFTAHGTALLDNRPQFGDAAAAFTAQTPLLYGFRSEVIANADRQFFGPSTSSEQLDASGRIHFMRQRGGVWLGSGVARPLRAATVSNVNISSGGAWTKFGQTTLRGSVTSFFFTKVAVDSQVESQQAAREASTCAAATPQLDVTPPPVGGDVAAMMSTSNSGCRHQSRVTDVEGSVRYDYRFLELTARGGRRFGNSFDVTPESKQWASAQVAIWLSSQLAAVAGGGREPAQPTRGMPARSYGSLGVMLAYWPIPRGVVPVVTPASLVHAFELRAAGPEMQRLTARIGSVESVEVMGDFNDWVPASMIRRGRDQWELLIPMASGVHQINLRIDGGKWIAPPGMPKMKDDFNGEVGIVVIKK